MSKSQISHPQDVWNSQSTSDTRRTMEGHQLWLHHSGPNFWRIWQHTHCDWLACKDVPLHSMYREYQIQEIVKLMLKNICKLHSTPKTIFPTIISDQGSVLILQVTKWLDKNLCIQLQPSTAYHPRTDGKSDIAKKKSVRQYVHHFNWDYRNDWEALLSTKKDFCTPKTIMCPH